MDDLAFLLNGTNSATLHLPPGVFHDINYAMADGVAHGLDVTFGNPASGEAPMRGGSGEDYGWHADDPGGILSGSRTKRGHATVALVSLSLVPQDSTCVHSGTGCAIRVVMVPDDWQQAKAHADLDNLVLMPDGSLFQPVPNPPGTYSDGTLVLGYPYLRDGAIMRSVTAHRCEGWSGFHCPICGTYHYSGNSCDHDPQCGAGHSPPEDCDCDPILVPFNCDDDDGNGQEDRLGQSLSVDEDDCIPFSPIRAGTAGQTSSISYTVLDWNDDEIATIVRKFVVSPSVSFTFDPGSVMSDGAVVVVKRSTDPVRINNTTAMVHATGLADGEYRLVTDLAKFHSNNDVSRPVELDDGTSDGVELYGFSPSSTMGDATLSLQTVGGTTLCLTNFTVLWVDISMRCGQDDVLSDDNVPGIATNSIRLGKQKLAGLHVLVTNVPNTTASIGNVVELKGTVYPPDFIHAIGMARDCISEQQQYYMTNGIIMYSHVAINQARGQEGVGNDPTRFYFQDQDPRPCGHVYDIDTPGFEQGDLRIRPMGIIFNTTYNFLQYAFFNGRRCSDDFPWFSKTTVTKEDQDGYIELVFFVDPEDFSINSCGGGHVPIQ